MFVANVLSTILKQAVHYKLDLSENWVIQKNDYSKLSRAKRDIEWLSRGKDSVRYSREVGIFRNRLSSEPCFYHGIYLVWRFLLYPVGNARENAEREIGNVFFCALRGAEAESRVSIAPQEKSGNLDDGNFA